MNHSTQIIEFFKSQATQQTMNAGIPFPLNQKGVVFAIEKGALNLFIKDQEHSQPVFLAHLSEGLLFNYHSDDEKQTHEIFALSELDSPIFSMTEESLTQILGTNQELQEPFSFYLEKWIHLIARNLTKLFSHEPDLVIFPDQSLVLTQNQTLSVKKVAHTLGKEKLSWIRPLEANLFFYGNDAYTLTPSEDYFPLTPHFWFQGKEDVKVEAIDTLSLIHKQKWISSLQTFHRLFYQYVPIYLQKKYQIEHTALENRKDEETKNLTLAIEEMESVVQTSLEAGSAKTELGKICQILGHHLKVQFTIPSTSEEILKDHDQYLDLICEASHIRKRKVLFTPNWWQEDHGPLLAFYKEGPIALIKKGNYRMHDLKSIQPITAAIAKDLQPFAYMFYPPLPEDLTQGKELIYLSLGKYRKYYIYLALFSLAGTFFAFFPSIATKLLFNYAVPENSHSLTYYLLLGLLFSTIGISFFYFLKNFIFLKIKGLTIHFVQTSIWDRILKLSPAFFRKNSVGNFFWKLQTIETINDLLGDSIAIPFLRGISSFFFLIIMFVFSPLLTLIAFGFSLVGLALTIFCASFMMSYFRKSFELQKKLQGMLIQMIGGVGKLREAGAEKSAFANWAHSFTLQNILDLKISNLKTIVFSLDKVLPILSFGGVYLALFEWIGVQGISLPNFLAFNIAFGSYMSSIYPLYNAIIQMVKIIPLWENTKELIEVPPEETEEKITPGKLTGEIRLNNVVFSYAPELPPVLNGINITVQPNEFVGIVGQSGCGKSTLIRLLLGFETPQSGAIYYNGKDLEKLDLRMVRKQLGVVLQAGTMMAGPLYENLACGGLYNEGQIKEALRLSGLDELLEDLPMGLQTFVQMDGVNLSGGQKQRVLLARALLGSPPILIFDEATSALDNRTQKKISSNIEELNVTRIVIAQRLSTLQNADRIYVLSEGKVVQEGTYEELGGQAGLFAEMLARQNV
ncbi:MAG: hypothetical protein COT85_04505 [Chlamydiae bacterium CG10_big_fil_rev_8_21_14_0_10_42_34]|nr:MAG: hypothetical protein COT85_04505 [Chlamydiae bacterium CG10_big_fil_rev_8_21_14_0_10_42_34]